MRFKSLLMNIGKKTYLAGIKRDELIEFEIPHYDSTYTHEVVWEDIYEIYHLSKEETEDAVQQLKRRYNLRSISGNLYVTIRTPNHEGIWSNYDNIQGFSSFSLEEVINCYGETLEWKKRNRTLKMEEEQRKQEEVISNQPVNLLKSVREVLKDK